MFVFLWWRSERVGVCVSMWSYALACEHNLRPSGHDHVDAHKVHYYSLWSRRSPRVCLHTTCELVRIFRSARRQLRRRYHYRFSTLSDSRHHYPTHFNLQEHLHSSIRRSAISWVTIVCDWAQSDYTHISHDNLKKKHNPEMRYPKCDWYSLKNGSNTWWTYEIWTELCSKKWHEDALNMQWKTRKYAK